MNYVEMLTQIFQVCIVPLLGILTTFLVQLIKTKQAELVSKTDSEINKKYMDMLTDTITKCVIATNQTYVDTLKDQNAFTKEAQEKAFIKTLSAVLTILSEDAKEYLNETLGDLNAYITTQIEAQVNAYKKTE